MEEWLRIFKVSLEELKSCAYRLILSLKLLSRSISSSGGALSFDSRWFKWFLYTHRRVNGLFISLKTNTKHLIFLATILTCSNMC